MTSMLKVTVLPAATGKSVFATLSTFRSARSYGKMTASTSWSSSAALPRRVYRGVDWVVVVVPVVVDVVVRVDVVVLGRVDAGVLTDLVVGRVVVRRRIDVHHRRTVNVLHGRDLGVVDELVLRHVTNDHLDREGRRRPASRRSIVNFATTPVAPLEAPTYVTFGCDPTTPSAATAPCSSSVCPSLPGDSRTQRRT